MIYLTRSFIVVVLLTFAVNWARAADDKAEAMSFEGSVEQVSQGAAKEDAAAALTAQATSEDQIPVVLDPKKASSEQASGVSRLLLTFSVIGVLGCLAWLGVRKYRFRNVARAEQISLKILTQFHLGPRKSLAVVRVAGESILIGVTDHNISMIKSLSLLDEDLIENTPKNFSSALKDKTQMQEGQDTDLMEDFSITGIRDFVSSRLKNMKEIQ